MKPFTLTSFIKNGNVNDASREMIRNVLKSLEGKFAKITIEEKKKQRSNNQNAFYHGVVIPSVLEMLREYGNDVSHEQVHEFLKSEVGKLNQKVVLPDGEIKDILGSSASLKTMEFEEYLLKVRAWAAEFGLILPYPNENINNY